MQDEGLRDESTRGLPATQRFEYWQSLFPYIDLDLVDVDQAKDFQGHIVRFASDKGFRFGYTKNDNTVARFGREQGDIVMLGLTLAGSCQIECADGSILHACPSMGIVVIDGRKPVETTSKDHSIVGMVLPRQKVMEALAGGQCFPDSGVLVLCPEGLAHLLESHLCGIFKNSSTLDPQAANIAVNVAAELAFGAIRQAINGCDSAQEDDERFYKSGLRYIELYCGSADLTAADIAVAIGCSRSHLYRIFAKQEQSIGDAIRVARMARATYHLTTSPDMPVQVVAYQCGYQNAAAFTRAFREEMGCTPSEFRQGNTG